MKVILVILLFENIFHKVSLQEIVRKKLNAVIKTKCPHIFRTQQMEKCNYLFVVLKLHFKLNHFSFSMHCEYMIAVDLLFQIFLNNVSHTVNLS